jgi:hypothetical protein
LGALRLHAALEIAEKMKMTLNNTLSLFATGSFLAVATMIQSAQAQIPAHNTLTQKSWVMSVTVGKYSPALPVVSVNTMLSNQDGQFHPYLAEYLEISAPNTPPVLMPISSHCTRPAPPFLTCNTPFQLSATDAALPSTTVQVRYYSKKTMPAWYGYVMAIKGTQQIAGQGGAAGTGVGTAGGSSGPTYTQIPPHNTVSASQSYHPAVIPTPTQYGPANRNLSLAITVTPNGVATGSPPYLTELLEVSSDSSAITQVHIPSQCTRFGSNNASLNCTVPFTLPVADASQPSRQLNVRYFADRKIPNSTLDWTGYGGFYTLITCAAGQCGTSGGGGSGGGGSGSGGGGTGPTLLCPPESTPMMPTTTTGGSFQFAIPQTQLCGGTFFIDPPVAYAYIYSATNSKFQQITMPSLASVADNDGYIVSFPGSGLPSLTMQAGQSHTPSVPVTQFMVNGINAGLQLSPTNPLAFRTGVKMTPATGPVTIKQTPISGNYSPPSGPGLNGDDIKVMIMGNPNNGANTTVGKGVEFMGYGQMPFAPNPKTKRWNIDAQPQKIRISFAQSGLAATYGNGFVFNFKDLNPAVPGCLGTPIITGATTTTSNMAAPFTISGTSFSDHEVNVPLAPPVGLYNWLQSDWVETGLTFGCKP